MKGIAFQPKVFSWSWRVLHNADWFRFVASQLNSAQKNPDAAGSPQTGLCPRQTSD